MAAGDFGRRVDNLCTGIVTGTAAAAHNNGRQCQRVFAVGDAGFKDQATRRRNTDIGQYDMQPQGDTVVVAYRGFGQRG